MQEAGLGSPLPPAAWDRLRRGDLVFWSGHVGIMQDCQRLLHANGHHMRVVSEPLAQARHRIEAQTGRDISSIRRLETEPS
jgi:cell wall-associated NlpC family hydrolase